MLMSNRPRAPRTESQLVSLANAGIRRDGRWLVRGVDFSIRRGEVVTLIGPNGAGKSTTAKLAIGVLRPDEGSVSRLPGLRVGYVPQKLAIDWTMPLSVRRLMRLTGPLDDTDLLAALASTGISHLIDAEVRHLSGGEFQRALLARAIARKPDLMVLDEPVQGVDFAGESALYDLIRSIRTTTGCGILMISHDLHMVMAGTDTVICLNGHVCCRGTPEVVSQSADYLKLFGNSRSLAVYSHHHDHTHLPDGRVMHGDGSVTDHCHPDDGHHHGDADAGADDHDHSHHHHHGDHAEAKGDDRA
ncbi:metal ABC transporter ATP-binding protein [Neorhizobium sp. BETTINA12A]|uniref:ATP-binding cassette domain-containing protein n=1 Tax=Neorhizobium sp. BETTINA12A TaxID=2908924 RepID=UPI001FF1564A|nr:metal ABC transporter ATP-binding protein [Neorhizobium sp. BETTINA12A]